VVVEFFGAGEGHGADKYFVDLRRRFSETMNRESVIRRHANATPNAKLKN
jgi:hypothetical protein